MMSIAALFEKKKCGKPLTGGTGRSCCHRKSKAMLLAAGAMQVDIASATEYPKRGGEDESFVLAPDGETEHTDHSTQDTTAEGGPSSTLAARRVLTAITGYAPSEEAEADAAADYRRFENLDQHSVSYTGSCHPNPCRYVCTKHVGGHRQGSKEVSHLTHRCCKTETEKCTLITAANPSYKFLFDNFEIRQEHMSGEIEALGEAKAFLKGMKLD